MITFEAGHRAMTMGAPITSVGRAARVGCSERRRWIKSAQDILEFKLEPNATVRCLDGIG